MAKEPSERVRASWTEEIRKNGVKRIRARALLEAFGAERRGPVILRRLRAWAATHHFHFNGLDHAESVDAVVSISHDRITCLGHLVEKEAELMDRFEAEIAPRLGLCGPFQRGHSPGGSSDKFDYLCRDADGRAVVVELKRADGEKRVVEQVLRYIQALRRDKNAKHKDPRGIIVTGSADIATRRAIEELREVNPGYSIDWWIYGVQREDSSLLLEPEIEGGQ